MGAKLAVGSSNMIVLGARSSAMLIATICLSPPLRLETFVLMYEDSFGKIARTLLSLF